MGFLWIDAEVGQNFRFHRQVDVVVLGISCEASALVFGIGWALPCSASIREGVEPGTDVVENRTATSKSQPLGRFSADGCGVALPEYIVGRSFQCILLEDAEIVALPVRIVCPWTS